MDKENHVLLQWKAVKGASGYNVYYSEDNTTYTALLEDLTETSCTVTSLEKGKRYYLKVCAVTESGTEGVLSTPQKVIIPLNQAVSSEADDTELLHIENDRLFISASKAGMTVTMKNLSLKDSYPVETKGTRYGYSFAYNWRLDFDDGTYGYWVGTVIPDYLEHAVSIDEFDGSLFKSDSERNRFSEISQAVITVIREGDNLTWYLPAKTVSYIEDLSGIHEVKVNISGQTIPTMYETYQQQSDGSWTQISNYIGSTTTTGQSIGTITRQPEDKTVETNGSASFPILYKGEADIIWHFVSPDGSRDITWEEAKKEFPTAKILNGTTSNLRLQNIPSEMTGWRVYARLKDNFRTTDSDTALITVRTPTSAVLPSPASETEEVPAYFFCPECGEKNAASSTVCKNCGGKIPIIDENAAVRTEASHTHQWVRSAVSTSVRTCSLCGERLRDIEEESLIYAVPADWARYRTTGTSPVKTLWFNSTMEVEKGTITVYPYPETKRGFDLSDLRVLAEQNIIKGDIRYAGETEIAGRPALRITWRGSDNNLYCLAGLYDEASSFACFFVSSSGEEYIELAWCSLHDLLSTIYFPNDGSSPPCETNFPIDSALLELQGKYALPNSFSVDHIALVKNNSSYTADIYAYISSSATNSDKAENGSASAFSVAPGETAVLSLSLKTDAPTDSFYLELYAEPSVYFRSPGSDLTVETSRDGKNAIVSAKNNSTLTIESATAVMLSFRDGELAGFGSFSLASPLSPLFPGKTASGEAWQLSLQPGDEIRTYVRAYGSEKNVSSAEPYEIIREYLFPTSSGANHIILVKNNSGADAAVHSSSVTYNEQGEITGRTTNYYGDAIAAGEIGVISEYGADGSAARIETSLSKYASYDPHVIPMIQLDVTQTPIQGGIIVTVLNNSTVDASKASLCGLFFQNGELVGFEQQNLTDQDLSLAPGESITKALLPNVTFDSFELYISAYQM